MRPHHHCAFCGWSRRAESETVMPPDCEGCGAPLRAATDEDVGGYDPASTGVLRPARSPDITGIFAVFVAWPILVPLVGLRVGSFAFAVPFVMLWFGATRAAGAAQRAPAGRRLVWVLLSGAAASGALASGVTVLAPASGPAAKAGFYLGLAASTLLAGAMWRFVRASARGARLERVVDAALLLLLVTALAAYFVAIPGFEHGDALLTLVFVLDLTAVLFASFAAVIRRQPSHRRMGSAFVAMCSCAAIGDALISIASTGRPISTSGTALLWAVSGFTCALAADEERRSFDGEREPAEEMGRGWVLARVVFPLVVVLAFPGTAIPLWLVDRLSPFGGIYFGICFVAALGIAFGRQAYLLIDNRRAVARERRLRADAVRRSDQLEALTGLATTMTQTLEEDSIIRRSLGVLHVAARASSSAIATTHDGTARLRASQGDWFGERPWADRMDAIPDEPYAIRLRGQRRIVRLPLSAHRGTIGAVTLIRPLADSFESDELRLLRLLADELALAIQHARDYEERAQQAIRDPLTGIYNRRFFHEAVGKELARTRRIGSPASLVLFDIDNFKYVNDRFGHAAGDDVLRRFGEVVAASIRPMDSFARIGGEEFGLLLPETTQPDALIVAERVRSAVAAAALHPELRITISAGIAAAPADGLDADDLHRRADAALYWSKRNGKNVCALASELADTTAVADEPDAVLHLHGVVEMVDSDQLHTSAHSHTVAAYSVAIGRALELEAERLAKLRTAALLHDVGKVAVPSEILNKPAALSEAEFDIVRGHSVVGGLMLAHAGLADEASWVRWHHERVDGRGYPDGLAGEEIPLEARILFVADSFEAMTSDRPYRRGTGAAAALAELERCAGTQFDAGVVTALATLLREGELEVRARRVDPAVPAQ